MLTMSLRTLSLVLVIVVGALLGRHQTHAKVNYKCVYGPVRSREDPSGNTRHFCTTQMRPPFMQLGAYVIARDRGGKCYECVCERENNIGMACCEMPIVEAEHRGFVCTFYSTIFDPGEGKLLPEYRSIIEVPEDLTSRSVAFSKRRQHVESANFSPPSVVHLSFLLISPQSCSLCAVQIS